MTKTTQLLILVILLACVSCSSSKVLDYYYPISKEKTVNVYVYSNSDDETRNEFWKVTANSKGMSILTESYDANFQLYNKFYERLMGEESQLVGYSDYENRGTYAAQEIEAKVMAKSVYKSDKESTYEYAVEYTNQYGKFNFTKERSFIGFEKIVVIGMAYKTAKFKDEYSIKSLDFDDKFEFSQTTFYAKGVGMVKYERVVPGEKTSVLELKEIISEEAFNKLIVNDRL